MLDARRIGEDGVVGQFRRAEAAPVLDRMTGYDHHITPRFRRQYAQPASQFATRVAPALYAAAARPRFPKRCFRLANKLRGLGDRRLRVAGVGELALGRRARHEFGESPRAPTGLMASGWKSFLPDESGQKRDREMLGEGGGIDHPANGGDERLPILRCRRRRNAQQGQEKSREGGPLPHTFGRSYTHAFTGRLIVGAQKLPKGKRAPGDTSRL